MAVASDLSTNKNEHAFRGVQILLRVVFAGLLFVYFYCLQSPLLALGQHQLSKGQTAYHPFIGSLVLTGVLMFVQHWVQRFVRFRSHAYVLSFVPSAVLAVMPTAFTPETSVSVLVASVSVLVLLGGLCLGRGNLLMLFSDGSPLTTAGRISRHLTLLVLVTLYMGLCSHNSERISSEIRTSIYLSDSAYSKAFQTQQNCSYTSPKLLSLKAFAAAHLSGGMGQRLFTLPLSEGESAWLLPAVDDTLSTLFSPCVVYDELKQTPQGGENNVTFLQRICAVDSLSTPMARDYLLCAYLLDRDLEAFVDALQQFSMMESATNDSVSLPHHYEEALMLYNYQHGKSFANHSEAMQESFHDFCQIYRRYSEPVKRTNMLVKNFPTTYWCYYYRGEAL